MAASAEQGEALAFVQSHTLHCFSPRFHGHGLLSDLVCLVGSILLLLAAVVEQAKTVGHCSVSHAALLQAIVVRGIGPHSTPLLPTQPSPGLQHTVLCHRTPICLIAQLSVWPRSVSAPACCPSPSTPGARIHTSGSHGTNDHTVSSQYAIHGGPFTHGCFQPGLRLQAQ